MLSISLSGAVVAAVVLAAAGLAFARIDVALLALPFLIAAAWAWDRRPGRADTARVSVTTGSHPQHGELSYTVAIASPSATDAVSLRIAKLGGEVVHQVVVTARRAEHLIGSVPVLHSGPQEIVSVSYRLIAVDASAQSDTLGPAAALSVVSPGYAAIRNLPLPHRLQGLTGTHESARPGDGGDFRDVHPFAPGDRMRRIDWKATARRGVFAGDLYVRRTNATADATVVVVLDSRDDVGEQVAEWSRNTAAGKGLGSLDVARTAAASIAAGYVRTGDRVGFQDLASQSRMVAVGGGNRHLQRLVRSIELSQPSGAPSYRQRPPVVPAGALLYVLSTFLDEEAPRMATLWRAGGHRVIAVDVLPAPRFDRATRDEQLAYRIVMMERADRIRALEAQGVDTLRWQDDDGAPVPREGRLRMLSRPVREGRR
jgi:uncharacterized protein (DUF58 family)